jgi:hypothetical protein
MQGSCALKVEVAASTYVMLKEKTKGVAAAGHPLNPVHSGSARSSADQTSRTTPPSQSHPQRQQHSNTERKGIGLRNGHGLHRD